MRRAVWTPQAQRELDDILFFVSLRDHRPETGERVYFEIRQLTEEYAQANAPRYSHPLSPAGWYYFRHKRWLIFYQLNPDGIEVMRLIDGSRDLPAIFS